MPGLFGSGTGGATVGTPAVRVTGTNSSSNGIGDQSPSTFPLANPDEDWPKPHGGSRQDPTAPKPVNPAQFWERMKSLFPWLGQMTWVTMSWLQDVLARAGENADAVVAEIRGRAEYKARFVGLWRADGTMRMNEAEYLQTEAGYKTLLKGYGIYSQEQIEKMTPTDVAGFFEQDVSPAELEQRLKTYVQIRDGSQAVRDAFYVYAGLDLTIDDLFEATVDERLGAELAGVYQERVSQSDYQTFIARLSDVARKRVKYANGILTVQATQQLMDAIYTGGGDQTPGNSEPLSIQELLAAYEEATLGAAATSAGLTLPSLDRIQEIRAAGISKAQAEQAYLQYALRGRQLSANAERAGQGAVDQSRYEQGAFLGNGAASRAMERADAYGRSIGKAGGTFRFDIDQQGGFFQRGLRPV